MSKNVTKCHKSDKIIAKCIIVFPHFPGRQIGRHIKLLFSNGGIGIVENTNEIKHLDTTLKSAGKIVTLTESLKKITGKS